MIEDNLWFVGKDLADALGYSNSRKALNECRICYGLREKEKELR